MIIARGFSFRWWIRGAGLTALCIGSISVAAQQLPVDVPEEVKIPRPTAQEFEAARWGIEGFLTSTDAETRRIVESHLDILEVRAPRENTAIIPDLAQFFREKHEQNRQVARQGDAELLLMGDSITDFWRNTHGAFAGKSVLDKYFGHWNIANFGIAGDTTQGVLYRLQNGEGEGFSPRAIMLMIGTNNTGRNTAPEIAEGIGAVVLSLQNSFPEARILLLGIFPRGSARDPVRTMIADINSRISRLHDGERLHYLDIGEAFLDDNGNIPAAVMSDGLHPGPQGYEIWAREVEAPLTELMSMQQ